MSDDDKKKKEDDLNTDRRMTAQEFFEFKTECEADIIDELKKLCEDDDNLIIVENKEDLASAIESILKKDPEEKELVFEPDEEFSKQIQSINATNSELDNLLVNKRLLDITLEITRSIEVFAKNLEDVTKKLLQIVKDL